MLYIRRLFLIVRFRTVGLQTPIFAALAEFEAELIRERTMAGLTAARARGRLGGRPRKMTTETLKRMFPAYI